VSVPRIVVGLAVLLLLAQGLVLGVYGQAGPGPGVSGLLQLGIGIAFIAAAMDAARAPGASRFERRFMLLVGIRYVIWAMGQGLATHYEFSGRTDFDGSLAHILFRFEDVALGIALCLDAGRADRKERPRLLDLAQILVFWSAVYLYIRLLTPEGQRLVTPWDALVATAFYLRGMLSRSLAASALFSRWTPVLLLSSVNHAYSGFYNSVAGAGFDLVWSVDMVLWILTVATWSPVRAPRAAAGPVAGDPSVRHLPLVVACFSLVLALGIAERRAAPAAALVVATAACLLGRWRGRVRGSEAAATGR
jgi:hypothetical protein